MSVKIITGDCRTSLRALGPGSVHCAITSPPYYGLRDYKVEPTVWGGEPACEHEWGDEVSRRESRRDNGGLAGTGTGLPATRMPGLQERGFISASQGAFCRCGAWRGAFGLEPDWRMYVDHAVVGKHEAIAAFGPMTQPNRMHQAGFKPKDRMMMPARVAIALCDDGWWLRDEIVWRKPNPMPSSVEDRTTPSHEMVYLLTKRARYFYDNEAIKEPFSDSSIVRLTQANIENQAGGAKADLYDTEGLNDRTGSRRPSAIVAGLSQKIGRSGNKARKPNHQPEGGGAFAGSVPWEGTARNKRSVWDVTTEPFPGAHFAVFPTSLVEPMIRAGTSERGCCPRCQAPWERVTRRVSQDYDGSKYGERVVAAAGGVMTGGTSESTLGSSNGKMVGHQETLGWWPTCKCDGLGDLPPYPPKPKDDPAGVARVNARRAEMCAGAAGLATVPAVVLDSFGGAGTVGLVADRLQRDAVLLELSPTYAAMARRRVADDAPLFAMREAAE